LIAPRWCQRALAAALLVAGCRAADSVLAVTVVGSQRDLRQLDVAITIGGARRTFAVPPTAAPIALPATFTVRVDRATSGATELRIVALDARGVRVAEGEAEVGALRVGEVTGVEVRLHDVQAPPPEPAMTDASPPDAAAADAAPAGDGGAPDARLDAPDAGSDATSADDVRG
jgi:hypothetical protein